VLLKFNSKEHVAASPNAQKPQEPIVLNQKFFREKLLQQNKCGW
jgi:hypothetical protein